VTSRTLPDGTVVTYVFDDDNRLTTVTAGGQSTAYTYDAAGNPLTTATPNTVTKTVTYDRAGRIATLGSTQGVNPIAS
jgi:YD repeat-containing protein